MSGRAFYLQPFLVPISTHLSSLSLARSANVLAPQALAFLACV